MIDGRIVDALIDAIVDAFALEDLMQLMRTKLTVRLSDVVATQDNGVAVIAFKLIEWAERHARLDQLVAAIAAERPGKPKVIAAAQMYASRKQPAPAPPAPAAPARPTPDPKFPPGFFIGRSPFINRIDLQGALVQFNNPAYGHYRAAIINGDEGSGKSFSWFRYHLASKADPGAKVTLTRVSEWKDVMCGPDEIAQDIADQLMIEPLAADLQATPARRALQLKKWLLKHLVADQTPVWIFIDELRHPCLKPGAVDFAIHALTLATTGTVPHLRVALADCGRGVDAGLLSRVLDDQLKPLTQEDVSSHVRDAIKNLGANLSMELADAFASKVFEGAPALPGHERMTYLTKRYDTYYLKLIEGGSTPAGPGDA